MPVLGLFDSILDAWEFLVNGGGSIAIVDWRFGCENPYVHFTCVNQIMADQIRELLHGVDDEPILFI